MRQRFKKLTLVFLVATYSSANKIYRLNGIKAYRLLSEFYKKLVMNSLKAFYLLIAVSCCNIANAQDQPYAMGATFDLTLMANTPQKVMMSQRSFTSMPTNYSLEKYTPTPGDQGKYGTCTAWANAYGVATILYAKTHDITDKALINKYAFSPTFLYEQIKNANDVNCQNGTDPIMALVTLIKMGDATLKTAPYACGAINTETAKTEALNYKISDASILFAAKGMLVDDKFVKTEQQMIDLTKKALTEGSPVSIGFLLPKSFFYIKSAIWSPDPQEAFGNWQHNKHAMCVIGYDDNIGGGAFRVLNSWGTGWADGGMVWIKYADYARWCLLALQPFADPYSKVPDEKQPAPKPAPKPEPKPTPPPVPVPVPVPTPEPEPAPAPKPSPAPVVSIALSGSIEFKTNTGEDMPVNKISTRNLLVEEDEKIKEDLVAYTMANSYSSGTKFRFYMTIDKEAYIYAFATDLTGKVNKILPFDDLTSTHVGSNTVVAFPSDTKIIKLDDNKGTDYLMILYSKEKLNMDEMLEAMNKTKGGLSAKIMAALGDKLIDKKKIQYDKQKVGFSVNIKAGTRNLTVENDDKNTEVATGSVVPLMIEIKHN